jgi:hypothetical protein
MRDYADVLVSALREKRSEQSAGFDCAAKAFAVARNARDTAKAAGLDSRPVELPKRTKPTEPVGSKAVRGGALESPHTTVPVGPRNC